MKAVIASLLAAATLGGCVAVPYYAPAPRAYVAPPPPVYYYGPPVYRHPYHRHW